MGRPRGSPPARVSPGQPVRAGDLNRLLDSLVSRITVGPGLELRRAGNGLAIALSGPQATPLRYTTEFEVQSESTDHLVCQRLDTTGATYGGNVSVMKPPALRGSSSGLYSAGDKIYAWEANLYMTAGASSTRYVDANVDAKGTGVTLAWYRVRLRRADYLVCRTWDGSNLGDTDVYVAKPPLLRDTDFDGVTYAGDTYTSTSASYRRSVNDGSNTIEQYMTPEYLLTTDGGPVESQMILAAQLTYTGVNVLSSDDPTTPAIVWQDMNVTGRQWVFDLADTPWSSSQVSL